MKNFNMFTRVGFAAALLTSFHSFAVDVQISQLTDTPDPATRGGDVTYAISLLNGHNDTATNVTLAIPLPATTSFVSVDDTDCIHDGGNPGTLNCSFGDITGNGDGTPVTNVNMALKTSASSGSTISLTATVDTDSADVNSGNDSSTQNTTVDDGADLNVVQSDSADPVIAGGNYSYAIDVNNIGPNTASSVSLINTLPTNVSYVSSSGSGWSCNDSGQVVTCTRSTIASGASAPTITINAKVTGSITGTVTNVVTVSSATNDPELTNNTSSENTLINNGTDLSLTTDVDEPVTGGSTTTFTLRPRNLGPFDANTVTVTSTLPTGFDFISAVGTGWTCGESSSTVTCTRATYSVGSTNNIVIETDVPGTGTNVTSTASISSATADAQSSNDSDSVTFSVVPDGSDLSITKSKSPNPVAQGDNMTSTIRVHNDGPNSTSGTVTVIDTLSANETYASFSGTNWSCTHSGGTPTGGDVTCEYKSGSTPISLAMDSNSSYLSIVTTATNAGTITNQACVNDVGGEDDNIPGNDCTDALAVSTAAIADLAISHSVSTDGGDNLLEDDETTITYVLNVTNTGDNIIDNSGGGVENGVVITANNIPGYVSGETTFTAAVTGGSEQNFTCTTSSNDARCVLNDGETFSGTDDVQITIITSRGLFDVTNASYTASVSSSILGESNKSDNSASVNVTIEPIADIELQSFTISPGTAEAGTDATYVLTYINNGPSSAQNVVVTHEFVPPASRTYELMSSSTSKGSCNALSGILSGNNTLTCNIGTLSRNETETLTLVVRPGWDGTNSSWVLANNASISTITTEGVSGGDNGNNALSENLNVSLAQLDLLVNNTDELDPLGWIPSPGGFPATLDNVIVYEIEMTNRGPSYSTGVTLTDVMTPESGQQVTFLCDGSGNSTCSVGTSLCDNLGASATGPSSITTTCNIPDLEEDEDYTRYLYFRADTQPKPLGDTHNNVATINSNEDDTTLANDSESETTSVRVKLDIGVSISPSKPSVELNEPFNWNIVVTNNGPGDSAESTLSNTLPSGMELTGAPSPAQGTCSGTVGDTSYTCDLGQLNDTENTTITVPVRVVTYPSGGTTSNPVTVDTSGVDTDSANDDDSASVTVTKSSITGTVYNDQNNNGVINSSEHGIADVTVSLSGTDTWGNTVSASEVTDSDGVYTFNNLPSSTNYVITEAQPHNFNDGLDNASGTVVPNSASSDVISSITLVTDTALAAYNFGNLGLASIAGSVWSDLDNDGTKDAEETLGISGVLITLTGTETISGDAINLTTTTDTNGDYQFSNITAGTYVISETQPTTWGDGSEQLGNTGGSISNDVFSNVVVTATQSATGYSFGEQGGTLSGKVYRDVNNNGAIDTGEASISGVTITLTGVDGDSNNISLMTTTDSNGDYSFTGVAASDASGYTISETQPQLVFDGLDTLGSLGGVLGNDQFTGIIFSANNNAVNYNFGEGENIRSSISGFVYIDDNSNGLKDVNERALENITVTLTGTSDIGAIYNRATTTDVTGYYQIEDITASDVNGYTVTQTSPTQYIDGFESIDGVIVVSSDTTDAFTNIQIIDDENIQNYNFAELYKGKVSGTVFIDDDNNGLFEITEDGVDQVNLTLTGTDTYGQPVSYSATSTANGSYEFLNVIPSDINGYTITETHPEGYIDSFESIGLNLINGTDTTDVHTGLVIALETELAEYNFGERLRSSITGVVFNDVNDDGIQSSEELGIEGVELVITGTNYLAEVVNISVTTNANGEYLFSDLLASNEQGYIVTESQPEALLDGLDSENGIITQGSHYTDTFTLNVIGGTDYTGFHFAEIPTASFSGTVWLDDNNNGTIEAEEAVRVNNVTLTLVGTENYEDNSANNENNITQTVTTDDNGTYQFTLLRPGNYTITQSQPAAWVDGLDSVGNLGGELANDEISNITLAVGNQGEGYNFGERLRASISGVVFNDINDDGIQSQEEQGIEAVELILTGTNYLDEIVNITVTTDENGEYLFTDLQASNGQGYVLTENQPEAYLDGLDSENGIIIQGSHYTDAIPLHVAGGTDYSAFDFAELPTASLSGSVWVDSNNNGTVDEDESLRVNNVTITLVGTENYQDNSPDNENTHITQTVTTDESGVYQFTRLRAGEYTITQTQPTAWLDGLDSVGDFGGDLSNDEVSGIDLSVGDQAQGYNFGERGSQLSGLVFNDVNDNALQETTESGIPSVTLQLTGVDIDNQPVNREVLTLVDGQYHFIDIPLSNSTGYTLTEIQPDSVDDGQDVLGDNGGSLLNDVVENIIFEEHITLAKGYNFSELLTLPSQISGMVWIDGNHNRTQDEDTGLGGWTVELIDTRTDPLNNTDLTPIATVITDNDGEYLFDGLSAGTYEVRFIHPQTDTVYGYPNSTEADVDLSFGTIRNLTVGAGEHIEEQDLPIDPSGVVYDSKTREPVAGATVTIVGPSGFDPDRDLVGGTDNIVQITDETGLYQYLLFSSAPSGVYRLNIVEPNGYVAGVSQSIPACVNTPIITASPNPVLVQNQDTPPQLNAEIHDSQSCATTSADFANNSDSTQYYLSFNINPQLPSGNILNNHIPVDPYTDEMFSLIKTSSTKNASRGDIVPYTISINNNQNYALGNINVIDQLPPGFTYIQGSATIDGFAIEPIQNGRQITWSDLTFTSNQQRSIELMTRIGSGVSEGEYVNQAWAYLSTDNTVLSDIADATVRIVPDPLFDCSDIVGKVFNDENANGYQDDNEQGLPAIRIATAKGLLVTTDSLGKYHIACAAVPNEHRGSNFVLKVDERTLPSGFRITTENPRVIRLTRGKLVKANFGATIHRVIRIQLTDSAFINKELNQSYMNNLHQAINALKGKPSIIRLAYAQADEANELVNDRIQTIENIIEDEWDKCDCNYELMIEKEVYRSNKIPNVLQKTGGTDHE